MATVVPTEMLSFSKFPQEVQDKIWFFASHHSRNIIVHSESIFPDFADGGPALVKWSSHARIPSILHTCKASRAEGLKHYKLSLGRNAPYNLQRRIKVLISVEPKIYVNWHADRICLLENDLQYDGEDEVAILELAEEVRVNNLQRIAFQAPTLEGMIEVVISIFAECGAFDHMKEVCLVGIFGRVPRTRLDTMRFAKASADNFEDGELREMVVAEAFLREHLKLREHSLKVMGQGDNLTTAITALIRAHGIQYSLPRVAIEWGPEISWRHPGETVSLRAS